ncbi:MAG: FAD-dependent monooxygenase [Rubrivivax sp.]
MHRPDTAPRRSLYHRYVVHAPAPAVPSDAPVVIVGGGPIGLATALGLARQGVRCVLLTAELQVSEGSRAIVFTRRSMEILQQLGVADAVVGQGLAWTSGNSFYRGERVFRMESPWPADERFPPMTNLQQQVLEQVLVEAIAREPHIELRWGHCVSAIVANDADGATLEVDTPAGVYRQRAAWVVAADGARSTLRGLMGLKLEGAAYEGRFVIADIQVDLPLPTERLAFFDPDWNRGNTVLMHREPFGLWRVDYQLPPDETPEQALAEDSLRARIDAQLALIGQRGVPWTLDWCSVYSARALTLADYVHGRVVFVGDAAHLLPIFGVRGANTGFQDAQNLAWKLGLVVRGVAGPALLASYSAERVQAAREIVDEAGKSTRFMTPPTRGHRVVRDAVLSLSLRHAFVRPLFHWRTSRPHDHRDSALNSGDGPAGDVLPSLRLDGGGEPGGDGAADPHTVEPRDFLLDHLRGDAFVLLTAEPRSDLAPVLAAAAARGVAVTAFVHPVLARLGLGPVTPGAQAEDDGGGRNGPAWLVRPDQHVVARWAAATPAVLDAALRRAVAEGDR